MPIGIFLICVHTVPTLSISVWSCWRVWRNSWVMERVQDDSAYIWSYSAWSITSVCKVFFYL